jgi:hypothetical protein
MQQIKRFLIRIKKLKTQSHFIGILIATESPYYLVYLVR